MLAQQRRVPAGCLRTGSASLRLNRVGLTCVARESRVGGKPIPVPKGTNLSIDGLTVKAKGPNGQLEHTVTPYVKLEQQPEFLRVYRADDSRVANAQHGLQRALLNNMVVGVSTGFTRRLQLFGTGYRAAASGKELTLNVGYSNPRVLEIPEPLKVSVERNTIIVISGPDKAKLGDFCSTVIRQRAPEPYKGKGIREEGSQLKLKEGKSGRK